MIVWLMIKHASQAYRARLRDTRNRVPSYPPKVHKRRLEPGTMVRNGDDVQRVGISKSAWRKLKRKRKAAAASKRRNRRK